VDAAELNGVVGTSTQTWSTTTNTLTDNMATARFLSSSPVNASNPAIMVTVQRNVPLYFARIFQSLTSVTVTAKATAEIVTVPATGSTQSCIVALGTSGTGVSISSGVAFQPDNCAVRTDASMSISGGATVTASGVYAGGTITSSGAGSSYGSTPLNPNAGVIGDPLASDAALQAALASPTSCNVSNCTVAGGGSITLQPGRYDSWNISSATSVTLSPGLYVVNNGISLTGNNVTITGTGVTIISSSIKTNGATMNLIAPGQSPTNGAVPGVVFASNATGNLFSFAGGAVTTLTGAVYVPNANFSFSGNATLGTTAYQEGNLDTDCLEVIASTVSISGGTNMSAMNCQAMGVPSTNPIAPTQTSQLVQ
jgi:hypothetical protein